MNQDQVAAKDFYKYQVWYFQILGVWRLPIWAKAQQRRFQDIRFAFILVILCIMLLLFALALMKSISQVREILKVFFMFATEISCMTKLLHLKLKSQKLAGLVEMMLSSKLAVKTEQERQILESSRKAVVHMRNFYGIMSFGTASLILLVPCFDNFEELPLTMFEVCSIQGRICYWLQYLFHSICLLPTCVLNITYDSVAFSLLCFLKVQLQMLVLRLEKMGPVTDPRDNERIAGELRECAAYYNNIVQFKDLVELFIKVPGSVQLMCSVLVLISNLYDMSTMSIADGDAIFMAKTSIYQLVMLWQIFIICYASNEVTVQSSRLCHSIYSSQWTGWNRSNRRIVLLMMQRFNSPIILRTFNPTFIFSLEAFGSIVNCSYSYFALLKRVNS
ncbi:odorant receptor 46a [Drosophila rhopaloa]|uniref:Odorant receptor n=1 Tax=Drosophila rhopaloa TaxID=1041015 RepID=A0A6P4E895_DRORH|nr:odorant receptor 46a [Drosophila rhopaloa]